MSQQFLAYQHNFSPLSNNPHLSPATQSDRRNQYYENLPVQEQSGNAPVLVRGQDPL